MDFVEEENMTFCPVLAPLIVIDYITTEDSIIWRTVTAEFGSAHVNEQLLIVSISVLLVLLLSCKSTEFDQLYLQCLAVHENQLPRVLELGNRQQTHARTGILGRVGHLCVGSVKPKGRVAFQHGRLEPWLIAREEDVRTGLHYKGIVCLERIGPCA